MGQELGDAEQPSPETGCFSRHIIQKWTAHCDEDRPTGKQTALVISFCLFVGNMIGWLY